MSSYFSSISDDCAIRQMRLIQQLWQCAQQGRLWSFKKKEKVFSRLSLHIRFDTFSFLLFLKLEFGL
jgi:hypothetical protein